MSHVLCVYILECALFLHSNGERASLEILFYIIIIIIIVIIIIVIIIIIIIIIIITLLLCTIRC